MLTLCPTRLATAALLALAFCLCGSSPPATAGTIIATNLPGGAVIVNIDARADGAAAFSQPNPPQALWYQPTPTAPALTVQPGTYTFRIINPADAVVLYPALTPSQLGQIYTGWTYNSPWTENYFVFDGSALTDPNKSQLFDGALAPGADPTLLTFSSAQAAYDGTVANGYYNKVRPAPPGRAGGADSYRTSYTFTAPTTLLFVIPDNILGDNTGGVSVVVQSAAPAAAVPEPASLALLAAGGLGLLGYARRRRAAC